MPTVIGFDTETLDGPPITVQFYSEQLPRINACIFVDQHNVLIKTLNHLEKHCTVPGLYVMYGHNLKFDLLSLFYATPYELTRNNGPFQFTAGGWSIQGIYANTFFAKLQKGDVMVMIVDGMSWFQTSLAKAAALICPDLPKLEMPEGLGTRRFTPKDSAFVDYAMRDAEVAYFVGRAIESMHQEYDINQAVSVADMASRIFQQHFISADRPIHNTGREIMGAAWASYHGGKNNIIRDAYPAWHHHVDGWDLSSAYPHAMKQLPSFSMPKLFAKSLVFNSHCGKVPEHGIYCITGSVPPCDWPVLFDHAFKPLRGKFENIWVTGYELNEALRADEVKLTRCFGHVYMSDRDPCTQTGMADYVDHFYEKKSTATDPVRRYMYKTLLNSLYGKFIQTNEHYDDAGNITRTPGPLFHPFMASLITGHTRAVMHQLEHHTKALHTSTDGILCGQCNSPQDGLFDFAPESGLGSIEKEYDDCHLALGRNKVYVLYTDRPEGSPSATFEGFNVVKFAKHGYQGTLDQFEDMIISGNRRYTTTRPNTLKMSLRSGKVPNKFEEQSRSLNIPQFRGDFDHAIGA